VLHNQPIAINDNLNHLRQSSVIAISPTISPFGIDGNMYGNMSWQYVFHFSPFDIKGKGLNCSPQAPLDFVHAALISMYFRLLPFDHVQ
jgi:hypothetical protein